MASLRKKVSLDEKYAKISIFSNELIVKRLGAGGRACEYLEMSVLEDNS